MTDSRRQEDGFTLIETLVTLAIVALVLASIIPFSGGARRSIELETAAAETASLLRRTSARARLSGRNTTATYDTRSRLWFDASGDAALMIKAGISVEIVAAETGLGGAASKFTFFAAGGSSGGRVRLASMAGSFTVNIDWLSGAVAIRRGDEP